MTDHVAHWDILDPTAPAAEALAWAPPPRLDALRGRTVGLRLDRSWRCYEQIVDVWQELFAAQGASVVRLVVDARVGDAGARNRARLASWHDDLDAAVVGLGN